MRVSNFLLITQKETPANAELISHQLMLRTGMIRKLGSGLYTWLPLGLKVLNKVTTIVRSEMNRSGALELLMPAIQPAELWQETERWDTFGNQLLKMHDRGHRDYCFGPTHEEVITDIMRHELKSYKQLPLNCYQIQTKFRDEIRPRFGIMRAREFCMKDAYSFHTSLASLQETYQIMYRTYCQIFDRIGLNYRTVLADTGNIGGEQSHEFQVLANSGEDIIYYSDNSDYAANVELAEAITPAASETTLQSMEPVTTPPQTKINTVSNALATPIESIIKTIIVKGADTPWIALVLRSDHELNHTKTEKLAAVATPLQLAPEQTIVESVGCAPDFLGPVTLDMPIIVDRSAAVLRNFVCGANQADQYYKNVNWQRDVNYQTVADLRNVIVGDPSPDGHGQLNMCRGIEVGHIFQLGDKYSQAMHATVLDQNGKAVPLQMGCYGLGVSRVVAAAIEQCHDAAGIIWPTAIAPFQVALIPIKMHKSLRVREAIETIYQTLIDANIDVLLDDRDERPGAMFADMDLIGIPHRLVLSERSIDAGEIEYKARASTQTHRFKLDNYLDELRMMLEPSP